MKLRTPSVRVLGLLTIAVIFAAVVMQITLAFHRSRLRDLAVREIPRVGVGNFSTGAHVRMPRHIFRQERRIQTAGTLLALNGIAGGGSRTHMPVKGAGF